MHHADIHFYFDPVCPFAWMTSKWVRMVQAQRDYTVDWRFISLRMINAAVDYGSQFPRGYEAGHTAGLKLLRVAARTRAEHGRGAVGPLYAALGTRIFDAPADPGQADGGYRGTPAFLAPALAEASLPATLADALDDTSLDDGFRQETEEALALTGKDVGTPIIWFQPPAGVAFFGPVISHLPAETEAVPLWDNVLGLAVSRASPNSSAACGSALSCAASVWNPARPEYRKTGTAGAGASPNSGPARRRPDLPGSWAKAAAYLHAAGGPPILPSGPCCPHTRPRALRQASGGRNARTSGVAPAGRSTVASARVLRSMRRAICWLSVKWWSISRQASS